MEPARRQFVGNVDPGSKQDGFYQLNQLSTKPRDISYEEAGVDIVPPCCGTTWEMDRNLTHSTDFSIFLHLLPV